MAKFAMVWGSEPPVFSIGHEATAIGPHDSGFTVLFDDAPDPDEITDPSRDPRITAVCLHCLIEDHPEIGRGLDLAAKHGAADLTDTGEWVGRAVEENES